jgi:cytosine/adenosine deaminase-related metal-dependent hydrolase
MRVWQSPARVQMQERLAWPLYLTILCVLVPSQLAAQSNVESSRQILAITNVTVIDATGTPARLDATVVIVGDRIAEIGISGEIRIPKRAQVVDGTSKFLIPGLWDMHVHLDYRDYLPLFIANGVTGVRVMWGQPEHQEWRKDIEAGRLLGPRMMIGSAIVDGPNPYWRGSISVANEAQARQAVAEAKRGGADFLKIYQFLPRDLYFDIADESKKEGISFEGHLPITVSAEEGSRAGQKSFEHLVGVLPACSTRSEELFQAAQADFAEMTATHSKGKFEGLHDTRLEQAMLDSYSAEKAAALSAVLKTNGTWQCPTLTLLHMFGYGDDPAFLNDPRLKYMPPRKRTSWDPAHLEGARTPEDFAYSRREFQKYLEVVGTMQKSGVGILAGTDSQNPYTFYGFSLHDELGFLVQAGLSPMEALQSATLNPARFFGKEKELGTVEKGKLADLILLDANPLDVIGNTKKIAAVVYGGKLYPRASLDAMLAKVEALAARPLIGAVLFKTIQEKGIDAAVKQYRELKAAQPDAYDFSEDEFIGLGYGLIHMKKYKEAIEIFKLSVEAYPASYNTYDSLAEAYMDNGDKELAIRNYQMSLQLKPGNANGIQMLKKLNAQ